MGFLTFGNRLPTFSIFQRMRIEYFTCIIIIFFLNLNPDISFPLDRCEIVKFKKWSILLFAFYF